MWFLLTHLDNYLSNRAANLPRESIQRPVVCFDDIESTSDRCSPNPAQAGGITVTYIVSRLLIRVTGRAAKSETGSNGCPLLPVCTLPQGTSLTPTTIAGPGKEPQCKPRYLWWCER